MVQLEWFTVYDMQSKVFYGASHMSHVYEKIHVDFRRCQNIKAQMNSADHCLRFHYMNSTILLISRVLGF